MKTKLKKKNKKEKNKNKLSVGKIKIARKIAKKILSKKNIRKRKNEKNQKFPTNELFRAKIKVIGIGGGGGSIVSEIGRSIRKASFVVADTDIRSINKKKGIKYFLFGQERTHGLGTGANPELAKQAAEDSRKKIEKLFLDQDIVILVASLGGGLGSGATEIFARSAANSGAITLGIFTLPFKFEGKNKSKIALKYLKILREALNVSLTIPNEKIFKIIDSSTPITQAFSVVNKNLIESLESLIDLIYSPGLINIDFADLRTILKGKGNLAFLNTIEESGRDRADKICKKILTNLLYQNNNFIPEKILFNISGPSDLGMLEIEKISKHISAINTNSKVIFGISKNQSKNKIKTTLLSTGRPSLKKSNTTTTEIDVEKTIKEKKIVIKNKAKRKNKKRITIISPSTPVFNQVEAIKSMEFPEKTIAINFPEKTIKKTVRRNALEIKKAEELEKDKRSAQEEEWEIPAFLRRVKFKS